MDNALLVGVNSQEMLRRRMDIVANNLANMTTASFKAEVALNELVIERPAKANDEPHDVRFTNVERLHRDMSVGTMRLTGGPLDFGLEEPNAFFAVRMGEETYYTRDGQFSLDDLSRLMTREGAFVLDDGGNEMVFDPEGGPPTVSDTGVIRQGNIEIGRLGVYGFETPAALEKVGGNLWSPAGQEPEAVELPKLQQGVVEQSNVNAISEVTRMIEISRAYTSASRLVKDADELRKTAISKLGQTQS
ncbi:MAG: flagellar biosynthesis protein FlgF [Ponticaulis sp.]|nr:flagellar biosynthesis protein FlgF [Ponticaulis sp.]|tara:strand:- start:13491 stop:14231 length:741 start_codon:yes stop_codon:yes gene_type:complete